MVYSEWLQGYAKEITKVKLDPKAKLLKVETGECPVYIWKGSWTKSPEGVFLVEDFAPGQKTTWHFPDAEVQYILAGKAEITYALPFDLYMQKRTFKAEAGDAYLIPRGAKVEFNIDPSGPYRKFCVMMPSPAPKSDLQTTEVSTYE